MASAKKQPKRIAAPAKKKPAKKAVGKQPAKSAKASAPKKFPIPIIRPIRASHTVYIDSSFFFPPNSAEGYTDDSQAGRYTTMLNGMLQAPLILPVGATIKTITIYYKNTSTESMPIAILKKSIDHYCFSGEVEVSLDNCPPGTSVPDNYLSKLIDHFEGGGVIIDNYLYFIQVYSTGKMDEARWRTLRGIRIDYTY
jgi:hypothetical protein